MIVVLDTNIWVSAIVWGGIPRQALERAVLVDTIGICPEIEAEIIGVLHRKFKRDPEVTKNQLALFLETAIRTAIQGTVKACRDEADDMFLECAVNSGADLIVTRDNDLLDLGQFQGIGITTARQYIDLS